MCTGAATVEPGKVQQPRTELGKAQQPEKPQPQIRAGEPEKHPSNGGGVNLPLSQQGHVHWLRERGRDELLPQSLS